jgi:DNA-binding PadR family transcriptional regulator
MHNDDEMRGPAFPRFGEHPRPADVRGAPFGGHRGPGPVGFGDPRGGPPFGGPPFGGNPFGGNPFGGPPFGRPPGPPFRQGPKVARGDVRAAILALLAEQPRNGSQIIQEISRRSGGIWKPSSGSVYPALQLLEDEGLIRAEETDGRRAFHLTEAGRAYVEARQDELAAPWEAVSESVDERVVALQTLIGQVSMASMQVAMAGSEAQVAAAQRILIEVRRAMYRILAADDPEGDG